MQPQLPADVLRLFHTAAVDRFLRTLILYLFYYVQTSEWLTFTASLGACKTAPSGLSAGQRRQQRNLATLRVLVARDYHSLLMGEGRAAKSVQGRRAPNRHATKKKKRQRLSTMVFVHLSIGRHRDSNP